MTVPSRPRIRLRRTVSVLGLLVPALTIGGVAGASPGRALPPWSAAQRYAPGAAAPHARTLAPSAAASEEDPGGDGDPGEGEGEGEEKASEILDGAAQYATARTAPAASLPPQAVAAAKAAADVLPVQRHSWKEVTDQPYDSEPAGYDDPYWSNAGAGTGVAAGRMTALASDGVSQVYAGAAMGGVWRSGDNGAHWKPVFQDQASISIGALTVDPATRALWVGTGEANTSQDSYMGQGVYRSDDRVRSFAKVGGGELDGTTISRLVLDGHGLVYAATSGGLWRHSANSSAGPWTLLLKPDPNPEGSPYRKSFISDVVVRPGTGGSTVLAVLGWRGGTEANGFYLSTTGGGAGSFSRITPSGAIDTDDIGRTTLAYSADGTRLYAIVESPEKLNNGEDSVLQGVFASRTGNPTGPWTLIADTDELAGSGSAISAPGYRPGVQAWYNQALAVDPANRDHVYVSLEETYESRDGGASFQTIAPYWNYGLACGEACPKTTHPDQHALLVSGGSVWQGNDGGVFRRPLSASGLGSWTSTNATLHTLQYYGVDTSAVPGSKLTAYWGGLQDNGTSLLSGDKAPSMIEPAGGDGGRTISDPANAANALGEYVDLDMYVTQDTGHSFRQVSPTCESNPDFADCDPSARFIAPVVQDVDDPGHWVAGGSRIWDDTTGWDTVCDADDCDWSAVHDLGTDAAGGANVATALAVEGAVTYAGWIDSNGNPGPNFATGIDTNYGGTWHRVTAPNLPQRIVAALQVDKADPAHVYAVFGGYSRRWIPGGGLGHVFESHDGGTTWTDISGNLPDVHAGAVVLIGGQLVVGTDVGVFATSVTAPGSWSRLGTGLPTVAVDDLNVTPDGRYVVVATHGRGLWKVRVTG